MNTTVAGTSGLDNFWISLILPAVSMSINMILSVPLNGYVIWLILGASREKMAPDFFSLNSALSEFLLALSAIWFLIFVFSFSLVYQRVLFFFYGLYYTARPLFQCCICVEYYMGVIHPVLYLRFKPLRYRVVCCCVLWLLILLSCVYSSASSTLNFYGYLYFIQNVLIFSVMLFCCVSVLWALKRPGPGDGDTTKRTSNAMKRRAFNIILVILTFLTINMFVYIFFMPLHHCLPASVFFLIFPIFSSFSFLTGFVQPLLYLHRSGKLSCSTVK